MRQTIFLHVPRTAGTSIVRYAKRYCTSFQSLERYRRGRNPLRLLRSDKSFTVLGHASSKILIERGFVSQRWYDRCWRFAFVRNTWDRLVSIYEFYRSFRVDSGCKSAVYLGTFESFVRCIVERPKMVPLPTIMQGGRGRFLHANSQLVWTQDIHFIGRFERLREDWNCVCRYVGLPVGELGWENKIERMDYRDYYDNRLKELVRAHYNQEIREFGFKFEDPHAGI